MYALLSQYMQDCLVTLKMNYDYNTILLFKKLLSGDSFHDTVVLFFFKCQNRK